MKHAIRTDPRLATSKSIIQLMTPDVNAKRNDGSLLDAWVPAAQRGDRITLEAALNFFFEVTDEIGHTDHLWRNRFAIFLRTIEAVATAHDKPVDPAYVWILTKKLFAKLSITVGTAAFHELSNEAQTTAIEEIFQLKVFPSWHTAYQNWRLDYHQGPRFGGYQPGKNPRPFPAAAAHDTQQKGNSTRTPPKSPTKGKKNPAPCMRHWVKLAVPTEEKCTESACSYTHAPPWKWPRSEAIGQIEKYFKTPARMASKPAVQEFVDKAFTTVLADPASEATRAAHSIA